MEDAEAEVQQEDAASLVTAAPDSLLELLLLQQTAGEAGVRLTFHKDLAQHITLTSTPFHFCALRGNSALAAFLHFRGVKYDQPFTIASFSANGTTDSSPWSKAIAVSARETALLAGFAETAAVLALVEADVPLQWTRYRHGRFPRAFRQQVRPLMEALVSSPSFAVLPGPARTLVVDTLVSDMARTTVWGHVSSGSGAWGDKPDVPEEDAELWAQAARLPLSAGGAGDGEEDQQQLPQYQFRMGLATLGRTRRVAKLLSRCTIGAAAIGIARGLGCCALIPNAGLFLGAFLAPGPALLVITSVKLHQHLAKS